jgi:hypothetical protein
MTRQFGKTSARRKRALPAAGSLKPRFKGAAVSVLCAAVLLGQTPARAETSDFAILESPRSFSMYNQFEQPITAGELAGFLPYSPLQIIRSDTRLGDQITRAMQCQYCQKTFFLLKDEKGGILGDKNQLKLLKGCVLAGDTVEIVKGGSASFSEKLPSSTAARSMLPKGTRLAVLFKYQNAYFVRLAPPAERFGWLPAPSREAWKRVKQTAQAADTAANDDLRGRLGARVEAANAQYKNFFDRFNAATGQQKSVPRWSETGVKTGAYSWILSEPYCRTGELDESTALLVGDLRDILIGKPFSVIHEKGRIIVGPKAAGAP